MPNTPPLVIHNSTTAERTTLRLQGEIDMATVDQLAAAVEKAFDGSPETLVLDLTRVSFLDSSAISQLIDVRRRARDAGVRLLVAPGAPAARLLALLGLHDHFETTDGG
jgi:anti-sigma B factor antagonist